MWVSIYCALTSYWLCKISTLCLLKSTKKFLITSSRTYYEKTLLNTLCLHLMNYSFGNRQFKGFLAIVSLIKKGQLTKWIILNWEQVSLRIQMNNSFMRDSLLRSHYCNLLFGVCKMVILAIAQFIDLKLNLVHFWSQKLSLKWTAPYIYFHQKASFKMKEGKTWLDEWFCYLCYASRINSILSRLYYLAYTAHYNIFLLFNNILCIYRTEILYVMTELFYPVQKMTCINGKISKEQKEKIFLLLQTR